MKRKTPEEKQQELEDKKQAKIDRAVILELVRKAKEKKALVSAVIDGKYFH